MSPMIVPCPRREDDVDTERCLLMRTPAAYLTRTAVAVVNLEQTIVTRIRVYRLRDRDLTPEAKAFVDFLTTVER